MNKILFSEKLAARRKECGYSTQYALAKEYNQRFPSSRKNRKEENASNSTGILGTIKHYENGNYAGSPKLDIVDNLCKILKCDVDYLLGNIECETHDIQFIHDKTGLSEDAIKRIISKNGDTPNHDFLNSFILSEEYRELEHNIYWIENNCHNIKYFYTLLENVKSAIETAENQDEFYKLDDKLCEYANHLEHNGSQIHFLMYQCNLLFGNFLNNIRKSWSDEVHATLEALEKPLPGL